MKQNTKAILVGGLLAVGMFGLAKAGQLEDGEAAYFKHDHAEAVRRAILGMQLVVVRYASPDADEPATRILCPYGILYGGRGWLVAHVDALPEMRLWRLDRFVSIDLLDRGFSRREDFDLSESIRISGVFML